MSLPNRILGYLDPYSQMRQTEPQLFKKPKGKPPPLFLLYLFIALGVTAQPFLEAYRNTGAWQFSGLGGRFVFGLIVGLVIFPQAYRSSIDPTKPALAQFGTVFALGLGWESVFGAAVHLADKLGG